MYLPLLQVEGDGVKPCRYICRLVEQRCPYFHPSVKDQYAGERVFKCIDPDIPDLESIQGVYSYGPPHRCYCPQHLGTEQDSGEEECRLLTPAQLRRNASRRGSIPDIETNRLSRPSVCPRHPPHTATTTEPYRAFSESGSATK
ncbi:uncharacterized protein NPIL_351901 [Nephila pilipes]|uniref:Uncharacterized protein n=1 Tax=Nephila pilipes TaxID=299642 RepID=A0A8X6QX37_NEPPI|nr:uncharacterized protein NPIL_351901 [Nephila pilipes]